MKSKQDFDGFIRKRMEKLEADTPVQGWEALSGRLEAEDAGTAAADEKVMEAVIFEKMSQLESPYQPASWGKLESKLNEEYRFVNKVIRYKSLELSLFLLLIALFLNYFPKTSTSNEAPLETQAIASSDSEKQEVTNSIIKATEEAVAGGGELQKRASKRKVAKTKADQQTQVLASSSIAASPIRTQEDIPAQPAATAPLALVLQPLDNPRLPAAISSQTASQERVLNSGTSSFSQRHVPATVLEQQLLDLVAPMPGLQIYPERDAESMSGYLKPAPKERLFRLGVQGASDFNRIITPPIFLAGNVHSRDRYALGYSGGLTVSWGSRKWEVETGLIYAAKNYIPLITGELEYDFQNGFSGELLKSFEFDVVSIPLDIRRHFIPEGKWRFYATAGVSMNTVMQADYFFTSPKQPRPSGPPSQSIPDPPPNDNDTKAGIDKDAYTKGLLQGGGFGKNTFMTANLGVGLERFISHRTSIFAQPQYQHSIRFLAPESGIGPFQDRIHTMRVIFGMRVKL